MNLRSEQEKLLEVGLHHNGKNYTLGDVTTINLTFLQVRFCPARCSDSFHVHQQLLIPQSSAFLTLVEWDPVQRDPYGGNLWV